MENLSFMLFGKPDENDNENLEKLNSLLGQFGFNCEFTQTDSEYNFLKINYDTENIKKIRSRGAGRPQKVIESVLISDIKERMKLETAEEIASSLGLSRSTFFRKLKWAEEHDSDYFV